MKRKNTTIRETKLDILKKRRNAKDAAREKPGKRMQSIKRGKEAYNG